MFKNIKLYDVSDEVIEYYKTNVRGNQNTSKDQVIKKLTRNVLLSKKLKNDILGNENYLYGKLLITIDSNKHEIIEISNYTINNYYWNFKHTKEYYILNKILGIKSDENKVSIV